MTNLTAIVAGGVFRLHVLWIEAAGVDGEGHRGRREEEQEEAGVEHDD